MPDELQGEWCSTLDVLQQCSGRTAPALAVDGVYEDSAVGLICFRDAMV